ncbi:hypothetical protein SLS62_009442 [Diatrype stigma]|uniref:Cytochrome P450 n=1 Tax=Diatrype stigma TaxID=117547 RepID=A0AAN9YJA1_9PEZI
MIPTRDILPAVTRVSTRVFMGEEGCRDARWLKASAAYAEVGFQTVDELRTWPRFLRPWVHWYLPSCNRLRARLDEARSAIQVHIDKRNALKAAAIAKGEPVPKFDDAIEWAVMEDPRSDPAVTQIVLSLVAIHTTTDLVQQTMMRIAQNPELFGALREEVIRVLGAQGLKKTALYELKLMDSVLKETQRLKPVLLTPMRRQATQDIKLSDGTTIRKGQKVITDATHMWSAAHYGADAGQFDGARFLRLRQAGGRERQGQLVSTSAEHLGFGHGHYACPGRFFAANEIKILLCHLLLKYDWELAPGSEHPRATPNGFFIVGDPSTRFRVRRRREELDLAALEA